MVSSAAAVGDVPPFLGGFDVGASSAVVHGWLVVDSVCGRKLAAAAVAVDDDDAGACFSLAYDCHDLRRSLPDVVVTASA